MIRVVLYSENRERNKKLGAGGKIIRPYHQREFEFQMACPCGGKKVPPFRDPESLYFLRHSFGYRIPENDWYSFMHQEEDFRRPMNEMEQDAKYGLCAIWYSRHDMYLRYQSLWDETWKSLSELPFDILIGLNIADAGKYSRIFGEEDYIILNYPCGDKTMEVNVRSMEHRRGAGEDGRYYMDSREVCHALRYRWWNDMESILACIDLSLKSREKIYLANIEQTWDVFGFSRALRLEEECLIFLDYPLRAGFRERLYLEGSLTKEEYEETMRRLHEEESWKEYHFFQKEFQIINHLAEKPEDVRCSRLPVLRVDRHYDGTYTTGEYLTGKNPAFHEILAEVISRRSSECESVFLVVDCEKRIHAPEQIDQAVYGFKLLEHSVEIFDKNGALRMFGSRLREACDSGNCVFEGHELPVRRCGTG